MGKLTDMMFSVNEDKNRVKEKKKVLLKRLEFGSLYNRELNQNLGIYTEYYGLPRNSYNREKKWFIHYPPKGLVDVPYMYYNDSIIRRATDMVVETALINGVGLSSRNKKYLEAVKKELEHICDNSDTVFEVFFKNILTHVATFNNVFIRKLRVPTDDASKIYVDGKPVDKIAGIEIITPTNIAIVTDKKGNVLFYHPVREVRVGEERVSYVVDYDTKIPKEDIIHIKFGGISTLMWAIPSLLAVMDDVVLLRRIEEDVYNLLFQHIVPLYHLQLSTEGMDILEAEAQVDKMYDTVEDKVSHGALITTDAWTLKVIDQGNSRIPNVIEYLEYFKTRVYTGLGLSAISFGEAATANRATGTIVARNLVMIAKSLLNTVKLYLDHFLLKEILIQTKMVKKEINDENKVEIYIPEIDIEWRQSIENHGLMLLQANGITIDEFRKEYLGKLPYSDDDLWKTYTYMFKLPQSVSIARDESLSEFLQTQQMPRNQYGGKEAPGRKADEITLEELKFQDVLNDEARKFLDSLNVYHAASVFKGIVLPLMDDVLAGNNTSYSKVKTALKHYLIAYSSVVIKKAIHDVVTEYEGKNPKVDKLTHADVLKLLKNKLFSVIDESVKNIREVVNDDEKYQTFVDKERRILLNMEILARTELVRVYCATKLYAYNMMGYNKAKIEFIIDNIDHSGEKTVISLKDKHYVLTPWKWHPNAVRDVIPM